MKYGVAIILGIVAVANFAFFDKSFDVFYVIFRPELSRHSQDKLNELVIVDPSLRSPPIIRYGPAADALIGACGILGNRGELPSRLKRKELDLRNFCQNPKYAEDINQIRRYQIWYVENSERKSIVFTIVTIVVLVAIFISVLMGARKKTDVAKT